MEKVKIPRLVLVVVITVMLLSSAGVHAKLTELDAASKDGILVFTSDDGEFMWWVDSRIYLDTAFYIEDKNSLGDGVQLRRARMAWKAILWEDWYAEIDTDFDEEAVEIKDAYLRFDNVFNRQGYVRFGNFRAPFGLEENTTSRYIMFMERSQGTDPLTIGRRMGLEVAKWSDLYRIAVGACGPDVTVWETTDDDMNLNLVGRFTTVPINEEGRVLHLGAAYAWRHPTFEALDGTGGEIRFRTRNETHVTDYKYLNTGYIQAVDDFEQYGGELAFVLNRLMVQGEYITTNVTRVDGLEDLNFAGGYLFASYFLTNDTHPYDHTSGEFGRIKPGSRMGALELALRYSMSDLSDKDVLGGESTTLTAGLTWYANPNVKIYANYTMVNNDMNATDGGSLVGDDDYGVLQARVMVAF